MSGSSTTSTSTSTSTEMVTNPIHQDLQTLYNNLKRDEPAMKAALKAASTQMAADGTWVGPAARAWASQLDGHARDCATQVDALIADVSQALAAEPAQVTLAVAQSKAKQLQLMQRGF
jgi:hypothetical protein